MIVFSKKFSIKNLFIIFLFLFLSLIHLKGLKNVIYNIYPITSFDGYYYALIAKLLLKEIYAPINYFRNVPDFLIHVPLIPIHSYIAYLLAKYFHIDLKYTFIFLSPIFSSLFVFSFYLYVRKFLPFWAFISGSLLGGLNLTYFYRNQVGRFDTDSFILFFVFIGLFLILKIIHNLKSFKISLIYLLLLIVNIYIFMHFYYKTIFSFLFLFSLILGTIAFYHKELKQILNNLLLLTFIFTVSLFEFLKSGFLSPIFYIKNYFFKAANNLFLPETINTYISELQGINITKLVSITTDSYILFLFMVLGFCILLVKHWKYMIISLPFIAIGILSFKSGVRFVIYLVPFLGLGIGYFYYILFSYLKKKLIFLNNTIYYIIITIIVFISSIPPSIGLINPKPVIDKKNEKFILEAKNMLTNNSYIWTTWSYGNVWEYVFDKGTYVDGMNMNLKKIYAVNNSLYTYSFERSYKLISYITNHFYYDYKDLSFKEFNEKVNKYEKPPKYDVYLLLNKRIPFEVDTIKIGIYGTKIKKFEIPMVKIINKCTKISNSNFECLNFSINIENKNINWHFLNPDKIPQISKMYFVERKKHKVEDIENFNIIPNNNIEKEIIIEIIYTGNELYSVYITKDFFDTTLNKLYFLNLKNSYFTNVYDNFPDLILFKISN